MASSAEEHIEDTEAPLFLRFINLLINDAIYLLDEALRVRFQMFPLCSIPLRNFYFPEVVTDNNYDKNQF
jgi:hypothetical protein